MFGEKTQWENIIQSDKSIKVPLAQDQVKLKLNIWVKKAIKAQVKYYNAKH